MKTVSEYYSYLVNSIGFAYEELVEMGYTMDLGNTPEVFMEYKRNPDNLVETA